MPVAHSGPTLQSFATPPPPLLDQNNRALPAFTVPECGLPRKDTVAHSGPTLQSFATPPPPPTLGPRKY